MVTDNHEEKSYTQPEGDVGTRSRREMRREYPYHGLFWGLLLILLGVLFFASQQGWIFGDEWWQYFLIGLGSIFIIDALVRYVSPAYRHGIFGKFVAGTVLIVVGVAFVLGFSQWWPLALIAAGVVILAGLLLGRR